ncbi:MAG TPA: ATPase domain-containing protein [Verrucomicrobiae bacterium]|jgi:circadian clock protein KaiC|nr:ATPase domain-containing protein [Verrucomicrobiae bacterium]
MAQKRVATGIEGLDPLIQNGFLPAKCYVVTGDAGTGKTTACLQFLLKGLTSGEKAVYVTVDERPSDLLDSASSLGWDLQPFIQDKSLVILDAAPYFSARAGSPREREVDIQRIVTDLGSHINRMQAQRLAIDPVGPLIKADTPSGRSEEQARLLIRLLQTQLQTTNMLSSHFSGRSEHEASSIEEFLASGVLALRMFRLGERFVRTLWVKKMRGTAVVPTEYEFNIQNGKGIVLLAPLSQAVAAQPVAAGSQAAGEDALRPFQVNGSAAVADDPGKAILQPFEPEKLPNK